MTGGPMINVDEFRHRPVNELAALLPDEQAVQNSLERLELDGVDVSTVRVLHDQPGADILDSSGAQHGAITQLVRWLQRIGYDRNILDVYTEALEKGEALLTVPCSQTDSRRLGRILLTFGAHGVIYLGDGTAETLTSP